MSEIKRIANKIKARNADREYVQIPLTLFESLSYLYVEQMRNKLETYKDYDTAVKNSSLGVKGVHKSVVSNQYGAFTDYLNKTFSLDLNIVPKNDTWELFSPEKLINLMRKSTENDCAVFKYLTEEELFNRLRKIYVRHLGLENDITLSSLFNPEEYGADSLEMIELVSALEEEFNLGIADKVAETILKESRTHQLSFQQVIGILQRLPT